MKSVTRRSLIRTLWGGKKLKYAFTITVDRVLERDRRIVSLLCSWTLVSQILEVKEVIRPSQHVVEDQWSRNKSSHSCNVQKRCLDTLQIQENDQGGKTFKLSKSSKVCDDYFCRRSKRSRQKECYRQFWSWHLLLERVRERVWNHQKTFHSSTW